ncbi:MAG: GAF domain-containing protein [Actinobacteria bacterium]|jgi:transcriptional regulator with GAF, ATPase, and Fis domain|nr:GAF domain-containing protein [Actinomycetota bacterium]
MANEQTEMAIPDNVQDDWQEILDILAQLCEVPAALIMRLRDSDIEVFLASITAGNPYHPGDSEHFEGSGLYCETVVKSKLPLLVPDASADERWQDSPDLALDMISYLGMPILWPGGKPFGTICILDNKRNEYSQLLQQLISKFKDIIESHLSILYVNRSLGDNNKQLIDYLMELQAFRDIVPICSYCKAIKTPQGDWNPIEHYLIRHPIADFSHGICPECMRRLHPDLDEDS